MKWIKSPQLSSAKNYYLWIKHMIVSVQESIEHCLYCWFSTIPYMNTIETIMVESITRKYKKSTTVVDNPR